jgi:di/tricarboxylate transporter
MEINALEGFGYSALLIVVGMLLNKMWKDLWPKGAKITWLGLLYFAIFATTSYCFWLLTVLSFDDNTLLAALARIYLGTFGMITLVAMGGGLLLTRFHKRLAAIEKHCGLPAGG